MTNKEMAKEIMTPYFQVAYEILKDDPYVPQPLDPNLIIILAEMLYEEKNSFDPII